MMSISWYCHWGWPKPVADIFISALDALDGDEEPLIYGPAHIIWADENFSLAQACLDHFDIYHGVYSDAELAIIKRALEQLAALPIETWDVVPDDYDGEHPENYPPPSYIEMVKV